MTHNPNLHAHAWSSQQTGRQAPWSPTRNAQRGKHIVVGSAHAEQATLHACRASPRWD